MSENLKTCDRCGEAVAAAGKLVLESGAELFFCNHHLVEVADKLTYAGKSYRSVDLMESVKP